MGAKFTEFAKEQILNRMTEDNKDGPVIRDNEEIYLRFDRMEVRLKETGIEVVYQWKREEVFTIGADLVLAPGSTFNVEGVEGRMAVRLL